MLNTKEKKMNLSTTYPQAFEALVYIGYSQWPNETNVATCGWCKINELKHAQIRKIMVPTFRIMLRTEAEAYQMEKKIHDILDQKFGGGSKYKGRAFVWGCCSEMGGNKPNRSDEWWYCSTDDIEKVAMELFTDLEEVK